MIANIVTILLQFQVVLWPSPKVEMFAWCRWVWLWGTYIMWSTRLHPTPPWSSAVTSTLVLTQVIQPVTASWSRFTLLIDGPLRQMLMFFCCCRQVCSSWPLRLRSPSSMQTGAVQDQRSLATWNFFLRSPHWWALATDQVTPTMWGDFTAAWTTSSYSQRACRFGHLKF